MSALLDTIRQICQVHGLKLNTDLGQHFLVDETVLQTVVEGGNIQPTDTVIEIGAGIGILTRELARHAKRVISVELDERWIPIAKEYAGKDATAKLEFIHGNALQVPLPQEPYKIIANIPYHITSPLLRHAFLESPFPPTSLTLLIQREVAETICDQKNAGILTIMVGLFGKASLLMHVPPEAFFPPPKVDSAVLQIDCFDEPLADGNTIENVLKLLKLAFSQKRKMLSNTIGKIEGGPEALAAEHIEATRRPQTLSVQEWIALARRLP